MVFNASFSNISVISWRSVLLVVKTGVPGETTDLPQVTDKCYHILLHRLHLTIFVLIGTDCICSCKSNYHTSTTTTAPRDIVNLKNICFLT